MPKATLYRFVEKILASKNIPRDANSVHGINPVGSDKVAILNPSVKILRLEKNLVATGIKSACLKERRFYWDRVRATSLDARGGVVILPFLGGIGSGY